MVSVFKTSAHQKLALVLSPDDTLLDPLGRVIDLLSKPNSSTMRPNIVHLHSYDGGNKCNFRNTVVLKN